jgi:hypothetical protein
MRNELSRNVNTVSGDWGVTESLDDQKTGNGQFVAALANHQQ